MIQKFRPCLKLSPTETESTEIALTSSGVLWHFTWSLCILLIHSPFSGKDSLFSCLSCCKESPMEAWPSLLPFHQEGETGGV